MFAAKRLFHIFAVISLCMHVMAQLSPLWATENGAFQIQICSGDSFETISIDENGNEIPAKPTMRMHDCAFCAVSTFTGNAANAITSTPPAIKTIKTNNGKSAFAPPSRFTSRDHQTRAPPHFS